MDLHESRQFICHIHSIETSDDNHHKDETSIHMVLTQSQRHIFRGSPSLKSLEIDSALYFSFALQVLSSFWEIVCF